MMPFSANGEYPDGGLRACWEDGERVFCRGWRAGDDGNRSDVLVVLPAAEHPSPASLDRLAHEYGLKDELDGAWAVRPLQLVRDSGRTMLVLNDPGGEPLDRLLGSPMEVGSFLRLAIGIAKAVGKVHGRDLVHKDIKPANILVNSATGELRLTGFGIASRLPRERQAPEPPETIAGTLAYMAPEQTGRMNRSIDSRSDLYSLGITLYQMLTGSLPFIASDPMEWVHCHIARKPVPPAERLPNVPAALAAIVMKLLAKTAEERYQTAAGLESDLQRCLAEWDSRRRVDDFRLGEHDTPDRLLIPERLYGREREVEALLAAFDRVLKSGAPELMLVSGYSGIGKSSVVNELHKVLVPPRGLFASGKFDQYKRDIPYSTLAQAFQSLIRGLLAKSEADLAAWRDALREALGPNGRLMTDLVPELKLIIDEQQPVAELPVQQAQGRFQLVFRRFIAVFARPEHPLALFLDDLQGLDAATLDLLVDLLTQPGVQHLLVIGAYRDNEVDLTHPLARKLDAIRQAGAPVQEIRLAPLAPGDVEKLATDALHCERAGSAAQASGKPVTAIVRAQRAEASLQAVQAELARVSRVSTLGELTASIAHEVNQPIAAARNNARAALNFLEKQPPDLGEVREALACIVNDTDRAGHIVDRIRDLIKKAPPQKDRFDLNTAINEVIALARDAITKNGVSVRTRLAQGLPPVEGDRVQLQQVVLNLILNAVEAMSSVEAGVRELSISTARTQTGGLLVAVRDSGPGIDPEHLERVFAAFYTTKPSGIGMGLSICRSIIDAHGGQLWAGANEPRGAIFRFTLPGAHELSGGGSAEWSTARRHRSRSS